MIYAVLQAVLITVIVAFSAVQMSRKLFPHTAKRMQARLAAGLQGRGGVLGRAGARLAPVTAPAGGCGSDDGCGTCKSCGTVASLTQDLGPPVRR